MEGDGLSSDKGMKVEWATVKDGVMVVGSFGKEYTNKEGAVLHSNNLWAVTVHRDAAIAHHDWSDHYGAMRTAMGMERPGYMIHEAVAWSPHHRAWYVFPRRLSTEAYDDVADEVRGGNTVIIAAHDFKEVKSRPIGTRTPTRGFSSAKFLPGSHDTVVLALKSEENADAGTQRSYIAVYAEGGDGSWRTLMEETALPIDRKFEGVEVLSAL
jgi:soluble calcium-activated nucleotidase 1